MGAALGENDRVLGDTDPAHGENVQARRPVVAATDLAWLETRYDQYATLAYSVALRLTGDPVRAADAVELAFLRLWREQAGAKDDAPSIRARIVGLVLDAVTRPDRAPAAERPPGGQPLRLVPLLPQLRSR